LYQLQPSDLSIRLCNKTLQSDFAIRPFNQTLQSDLAISPCVTRTNSFANHFSVANFSTKIAVSVSTALGAGAAGCADVAADGCSSLLFWVLAGLPITAFLLILRACTMAKSYAQRQVAIRTRKHKLQSDLAIRPCNQTLQSDLAIIHNVCCMYSSYIYANKRVEGKGKRGNNKLIC
jgi:hypothetical protein